MFSIRSIVLGILAGDFPTIGEVPEVTFLMANKEITNIEKDITNMEKQVIPVKPVKAISDNIREFPDKPVTANSGIEGMPATPVMENTNTISMDIRKVNLPNTEQKNSTPKKEMPGITTNTINKDVIRKSKLPTAEQKTSTPKKDLRLNKEPENVNNIYNVNNVDNGEKGLDIKETGLTEKDKEFINELNVSNVTNEYAEGDSENNTEIDLVVTHMEIEKETALKRKKGSDSENEIKRKVPKENNTLLGDSPDESDKDNIVVASYDENDIITDKRKKKEKKGLKKKEQYDRNQVAEIKRQEKEDQQRQRSEDANKRQQAQDNIDKARSAQIAQQKQQQQTQQELPQHDQHQQPLTQLPATEPEATASNSTTLVHESQQAQPKHDYSKALKTNTEPTATNTNTFIGKRTISANIDGLNFNKTAFCKDLARAYPQEWQLLDGIQERNFKRTLELSFTSEKAKDRIIYYGLNTHGTHLKFIPDIKEPTHITIWNLPLELPGEEIAKVLEKYGIIVQGFRHKEKINDKVLYTGRRIYKVHLNPETVLPKNISICGHKGQTQYNGQQEIVNQKKAEQKNERQEQYEKRKKDNEEAINKANEMTHEMQHKGGGEKYTSPFHPTRPDTQGCDEMRNSVKESIQDIKEAKKEGIFGVFLSENPPPKHGYNSFIEKDCRSTELSAPYWLALIAMGEAQEIPRRCYTQQWPAAYIQAVGMFCEFGFSERWDLDHTDSNVFSEAVLREYQDIPNYDENEEEALYRNLDSKIFNKAYITLTDKKGVQS